MIKHEELNIYTLTQPPLILVREVHTSQYNSSPLLTQSRWNV